MFRYWTRKFGIIIFPYFCSVLLQELQEEQSCWAYWDYQPIDLSLLRPLYQLVFITNLLWQTLVG